MSAASVAPAFVIGGGINGLGVAQSLGCHGVPVELFGQDADDIAYHSRYVRVNVLSSSDDPLALLKQLKDCAALYRERPVLFVATDQHLKLLLSIRDVLQEGFNADLIAHDKLDQLLDKAQFADLCAQYDIPAPRSCCPRSLPELEAQLDALQFPLILKPSLSHQWSDSSRGDNSKIVKVAGKEALLEQWQALAPSCDRLLVQEYIPGEDSDHFAYCAYRSRKGEIFGICTHKLRLYPVNQGSSTLLEIVHEPKIETAARDVLDALDFFGTASLCFKRNPETGEAKIFEVNARLPYWHNAFGMCGMNLAHMMYLDALGQPMPTPGDYRYGGRWVWLVQDTWAFLSLRENGEISLWQWLSSYRGTRVCAEFSGGDLGPSIWTLRHLTSLALKKIGRLLRR